MADILNDIVAYKREELKQHKTARPLATLEKEVEPLLDLPVASMKQSLMDSQSGIIAEFKRKSPSKGWIKESGRAEDIPLSYQQNGAAALSILTDSRFFGGEDTFIRTARDMGVTLPVIYKNFVIDPYQLFQAKACGASAALLIAACLTKSECKALLQMAHDLRLEVLLEMHGEPELEYAELEPDMCGINNRNLGTFITKVENSFRLAELLPEDACKVSESGISKPQTIKDLRQAGFNGFLIGETFMKTDNPGETLRQFIKEVIC